MRQQARNLIGLKLLTPIVHLLIGATNLRLYQTLDWEAKGDRLRQPDINYPSYCTSPLFHSIHGGYLKPIAAITYSASRVAHSSPNRISRR
jgi:hypothetical protein